MNNINNTIILEGCIEDFKKENEINFNDDEVFEIFSTTQITKGHELSYEDISQGVIDNHKDGGIDIFLILVNDKNISSEDQLKEFNILYDTRINVYIIQAKNGKSFKESILNQLITNIPFLFDLELDQEELFKRFNPNLVEKLLIFREVWHKAIRKGSKIKIEFSYTCKANENQINTSFDSKIGQLINCTKRIIHGSEIIYKNYSANELLILYQKSISKELDLEFKENPMAVIYKNNQIGYIGTVQLFNFSRFIVDEEGNLRENIFESNIRHFQGNVDVNQQIQQTVVNDFDRDFWWLNNGITIIASQVRPFGKKLILNEVQIVNGLQTSFIIAKYYKKVKNDDRSVLVKVIDNKDKDTVDKIISATNRQNAVSPILLKATDEVQRKIELFFLNKGYYYDRRKNYYKNQGKPSSKIFSIQFTAQSIHSIKNFDPSSARAIPTTIIKRDKTYKKIFNRNTNFNVFLNCCIIVRKTIEFIRTTLNPEDKSLIRNYTYHLARIVTSLITSKASYSENDLNLFDLSKLNINIFNKSLHLLGSLIEEYNKKHPTENVINISKSKKFSEEMNQKLIEMLK